jgi:hypothetical protein
MEHDITVDEQSVLDMKRRLEELEKLRADPDRKDIDGLKQSRDHIIWTTSILSTVLFTLGATFWALYGKFKLIVWEDSIKPRLKRYLATLMKNPPTSEEPS